MTRDKLIKTFLLIIPIFLVFFVSPGFAFEIRVPENQPTIRAAVDAALPGDTIIVSDGLYQESYLPINKPLTVKSENGAAVTTVECGWTCFEVQADFVTIEGFTFTQSSYPSIQFIWSKHGNIRNNRFISSDQGLVISGQNHQVIGNEFDNIGGFSGGIYLSGADNCDIKNNIIINGGYGIRLYDSDNNTIAMNVVSRMKDWALYANNSVGNKVTNNRFTYNDVTPPFITSLWISGAENTVIDNIYRWNGDTVVEENVALGKPVTQSSNQFGKDGSEAVDGETNGNWSYGSVSSTDSAPYPYWTVDLEHIYSIDQIRIYNRTDCCTERLSDFFVEVSEDDESYTQAIFRSGNAGERLELNLNGLNARYVRIRMDRYEFLSLAEVEVYGTMVEW
jgi:parallel beta-helix repeat protein